MWRSVCRTILLFSFLPVPLNGQVAGLDPSRDITQYSHRFWTKRDGLPQNSVTSIAQTDDGYLWFGTMEGLARFNGTSFSSFNTRNTPQLGVNSVLSLLADHDGALWIGTSGGGLSRMSKGEFRRLTLPAEPEQIAVRALNRDREGDVWASTTSGLAQFHGDSLKHLYTVADGLPSNTVYFSEEDREGRILALTPQGIWIREGDCFEPFIVIIPWGSPGSKSKPALQSKYSGKHALAAVPTTVLCDRDGALWIGTGRHGLFILRDDSLHNINAKDGLGAGEISSLVEDQRGTIWVGTTAGGLSRFVNDRLSRFTSNEGLSGDEVRSIFEDREGVLWVGISAGGVNRFVNSKFTTYRTGVSTAENMVWGIFTDPPGRLYASTASGTLVEHRNGVFVPSSIAPGRKHQEGPVFAFVHDRSGVRWVGGMAGITRYAGQSARDYRIGATMSLMEDRYGRIWAASSEGLWCFVGEKAHRVLTSEGGQLLKLRDVGTDRSGNLWLGSRFEGIMRYRLPGRSEAAPVLNEKTCVKFTRQQGLSSDLVTTMVVDSAGTVWVASGGSGLNVIRGTHVSVLSPAQGLPEEGVMGVVPDGHGWIWLTSNNGVYRIGAAELTEYFDGRRASLEIQSFGTSDGMYSDEFNGGYQASVARTPDGKLWFPSTFGIVMVDPAHLPTNTIPPALVLERVRIDNTEGLPIPGVEYPPGNGEFEFHFAGLSSNAPERIQYRYILEGFNKDWIDAGARREAFYTNIPPGKYRFRVIARNADGVWNEAGISFPFVLRPHFSQTAWFGVLIGLVALVLVTSIWYLYKRDRDRELQASQLESQLTQAQLQILEMQLQPHFLFNTLNGIMVLIKQDPDMASRMIARLSEFLRLTLESAGEQEVTLRRELEYLSRYIQIEQLRFGDRLTVEQLVDPGVLEALVPNLILQPLVENAIKHGVSMRRGPAHICVEAVRENGSLTIHVRDNGGGMPAANGGQFKEGIGIRNTRARMQHLYGTAHGFELSTPAGGGVDVRLTIPYHMSRVA
jgi:ligand-binding sensor domain-containing protein/two-component sensor histidine kinase